MFQTTHFNLVTQNYFITVFTLQKRYNPGWESYAIKNVLPPPDQFQDTSPIINRLWGMFAYPKLQQLVTQTFGSAPASMKSCHSKATSHWEGVPHVMNPHDVTRQADAELHPPPHPSSPPKRENENEKKNLQRERHCLADRLPVIHHT